MKKILLVLTMAVSMQVAAQGIKTPAPSPKQTVKQEFGLSTIEVEYSRPSKKGRAIFGDLVPFGALWRTGANAQTLVTFGEDVTFGGKAVKAGKYSILSVPGATEWEIALATPETSVFNYKAENEVVRVKATAQKLPFEIETFTIMLDDITTTSLNLGIMWGNQYVAVPVKVDIDTKVMAQIDNAMNKDTRPYYQAASYYFENGKDLAKALEWVNKAVEAQPTAYWVAHLKAKIQAKAGDKAGAKATAMKSMELAKEAKNNDYVVLNEKLIKSL